MSTFSSVKRDLFRTLMGSEFGVSKNIQLFNQKTIIKMMDNTDVITFRD
jgi:hypothetical protein